MTMAQYCGICGFVKADPTQGMGYAGNICTGHDTYKPAHDLSSMSCGRSCPNEIAKVRKDTRSRYSAVQRWKRQLDLRLKEVFASMCQQAMRARYATTMA
jgi:hypothetical protein